MITSWPALAAFTPPLMPCKEHRSLVHCHGHDLIQLYCQSSGMGNFDRGTCAGHKAARSLGGIFPMAMHIFWRYCNHSGEGMAASVKRQCPQLQAAHPPGHDDCTRGEAALQDLVPADEDAALSLEEGVDAAHKPGLQVELVLQPLLLNPPLARLTLPPPHLGTLQQHRPLRSHLRHALSPTIHFHGLDSLQAWRALSGLSGLAAPQRRPWRQGWHISGGLLQQTVSPRHLQCGRAHWETAPTPPLRLSPGSWRFHHSPASEMTSISIR